MRIPRVNGRQSTTRTFASDIMRYPLRQQHGDGVVGKRPHIVAESAAGATVTPVGGAHDVVGIPRQGCPGVRLADRPSRRPHQRAVAETRRPANTRRRAPQGSPRAHARAPRGRGHGRAGRSVARVVAECSCQSTDTVPTTPCTRARWWTAWSANHVVGTTESASVVANQVRASDRGAAAANPAARAAPTFLPETLRCTHRPGNRVLGAVAYMRPKPPPPSPGPRPGPPRRPHSPDMPADAHVRYGPAPPPRSPARSGRLGLFGKRVFRQLWMGYMACRGR